MTDKSHYDLLEVSPSATQEEIKEAYRLLVSMLHPDKFVQGSKQWTRAHEKTQEINEAYSVLKDSQRRAQYDRNFKKQDTAAEDTYRRYAEAEEVKHRAEEAKRRADEEAYRQAQERRCKAEETARRVADEQKHQEAEQRHREEQWRNLSLGRQPGMSLKPMFDFSPLGEAGATSAINGDDLTFCYHCGLELKQPTTRCPECEKDL